MLRVGCKVMTMDYRKFCECLDSLVPVLALMAIFVVAVAGFRTVSSPQRPMALMVNYPCTNPVPHQTRMYEWASKCVCGEQMNGTWIDDGKGYKFVCLECGREYAWAWLEPCELGAKR